MVTASSTDAGDHGYEVTERGRLRDAGISDDDRFYSMWMHLSAAGHIVVPLFTIAVPIIMWHVRRSRGRFIDDHGREAINFQISLMLYTFLLPIATGLLTAITCGILFPLVIISVFVPYVLGLIGIILASQASMRGEIFRYPATIRLVPPARVA